MSHARVIGIGTITGFVAQFAALCAGILTVPLLLRSVGLEPYGLLAVVSSLVGFVGMADLGMTETVTNAISYARSRGDWSRVNRLFSGGVLVYLPVAVLVAAVFAALLWAPFVSLERLLKIGPELAAVARPVIAVMLFYTVAGIFFGGMLKSLYHGANSVAAYNMVQAVYTVVFSAAFIWYLWSGSVSLMGVVWFQAAGSFARLALLWLLARLRFDWFTPQWSWKSVRTVRPLLSYSVELLLTVLSAIIVAKSDNLVLAFFLGVGSVAVYSIAFKLFHLPGAMLPITTAAQPTVAGLCEQGDRVGLARLYRQILRVNALSKFIMFGFMAVFAQEVVLVWVGPQVFAGYTTIAAIALFHMLFVWNGTHILFTNAMFNYRVNLIPSLVSVVINLGLSIFLVRKIGMAGVALGTFFAFLFTTVWYIPRYLQTVLTIAPLREAWHLLSRMVPLFAALLLMRELVMRYVPSGVPQYAGIAAAGLLFAVFTFFGALTSGERRFLVRIIRNRLPAARAL